MHGTKQHSRSFIQHVDIVWMYLHWRFLNGYWGKYLKCRKYVHGGHAQTYQDSSKPPWGLGWVVLHLSTSTSLCRSTGLAEGCWGLFPATPFSHYGLLFVFICPILASTQVFIIIISCVCFYLLLSSCAVDQIVCECHLPGMLLFHYWFCWNIVHILLILWMCIQLNCYFIMMGSCLSVFFHSQNSLFHTHSKQEKATCREKNENAILYCLY